MSLSTRSIFPLFESVCVLDGRIQNAAFHSQRFLDSFKKFYWENPNFDLFEEIIIPEEYQIGKVKLRISYNKKGKEHFFQLYRQKKVGSLKVVFDDTIDYELKFENRHELDLLYKQKMDCDDILIVRNGWVTDSFYANIVLWDGLEWYTPNTHLLKGTKKSQLLSDGFIQEAAIRPKDLKSFQGFQLINAMLDFHPEIYLPITNIIL